MYNLRIQFCSELIAMKNSNKNIGALFHMHITWKWALVSYRMMFGDKLAAGSSAAKVNNCIH